MQISAFIQNPIENSDSAVTNIGIRTQLPKHTKILAKILLRNPTRLVVYSCSTNETVEVRTQNRK